MRLRLFRTAVAVAVAGALAACGSPAESPGTQELTVYSGRSEELVGPILQAFEQDTGIVVHVRYGDTAELAAQILEEGDRSPADVFFGQDAGALGALAREGRVVALDAGTLNAVPARFRSPDGLWVGVSGRARTLVYNTDMLDPGDLPSSVTDLTDDRWRDQVGWAPTNGSFQAFVTALRRVSGDEAAARWLRGMRDNGARVYPRNTAIVDAVASGEVPVGLVNHYYALQMSRERPNLPVANHFFEAGDAGVLVNVAGAAVLRTSQSQDAAASLLEFLLSQQAQTYFAEETFEYPLAQGIAIDERLIPLGDLSPPDIDLSDLDDLQGTLEMLTDTGVL